MKLPYIFLLVSLLLVPDAEAQSISTPDVQSYHVYLEPNILEQQIKGNVDIKFKIDPMAEKVTFDCGDLTVTRLEGEGVKGFEQIDKKVIVSLANIESAHYEVQIDYKGSPKKGLIFLPSLQQCHTLYFTSDWMICNFAPDDKATLKLDVLVSDQLTCIASGVLTDSLRKENGMKLYSWSQEYETPAYTYGFALGAFNEFHDEFKDIRLDYYAHNHTPKEIEKIFQYTGDMMSFFEEKSGIPFPQNAYVQILIGNHYQEMSGFSILKNTYGELVLKDSTETNLISHELAHQWWGNRITCKSWNHFWLNEGFATFLSAVYNEHRFGPIKYQKDMDAYLGVYEKIKSKGGDKPLVFDDWTNPTRDDRNLVYFKGAYVLHLLRKELGEELFWNGVKFYTQKFYGESVTTEDFQLAMEQSTNRDLSDFFNTWIY